MKTNYVTNGFIQEEPLRDLKGVIDAMNIDVKAFRETFYEKICHGKLAPVLRACELALELGIHVELTYLIIPEQNDSDREITDFCKWVVNSMRSDVPVHFSAFHPDYKMADLPQTPEGTMARAHEIARRDGMEFVYLGNVYAGDKDDTFCPKCVTLVIERDVFWVRSKDLKGSQCGKCGASLNLVVEGSSATRAAF